MREFTNLSKALADANRVRMVLDLSVADNAQAVADAKRLRQILKIDPTKLCRKQCRQ
jgi:hypothetical protein